MKKLSIFLLAIAAAAAVPLVSSAAVNGSAAPASADTSPKGTAPMSDGEIKKIDKDAGKITIKHGPLVNLEMPGMTMVFRVKDAAMLDQVKVGDKVKFNAEKASGALTVTGIEAAK
ncbi:copper-binding protein [Massilia sp. P8910]|uniref:copper-binding protein n=1 Tax=Massilia antarctica TaxID=2765360 RepID=UPI001E5F286E|nr:copper-binding protein [Massilia antarctica]MCE3602826.1 copper-binding protein [Massilia antarctica]